MPDNLIILSDMLLTAITLDQYNRSAN